ncbi:hypothetical protein SuNHUV7_34350 (plasmid) [Pseudoseohaeicola sp. NH-UV-7]|uniref:DUF2254 domain-containing protein n=1 Tax=unclassified Sulfitobacter TaxID=196795 RepID=UPI0020C7C3A7|nr:DUF2254 domain-containing protein [Sulfitobacter sp. JL08]
MITSLPATALRKLRQFTRKLWVRVVLMGLLAIASLGLTQLFNPVIPARFSVYLHEISADRLLDIIANAMLAVTTFALTVMVSVYRSSASQWTPRVHSLIMEDTTTQNTLAVFIGAYVYALTAIIMQELGVYSDEHGVVLFGVTVLVLLLIVIYLIRWTLHLQTLGSLLDTSRDLESQTRALLEDRREMPCLGANPLTRNTVISEAARDVLATETGYIRHIYPEALNEAAEKTGMNVYLVRAVGSFVFRGDILAHVSGTSETDSDTTDFDKTLLDHITIGDQRSYDQDPRFGLLAMGEIASKALSPGVNDPGTAIDIITRLGRILMVCKSAYDSDETIRHPFLWSRPMDPADLLEDAFGALARDGANNIEVQQRLQHTLTGLIEHAEPGIRTAAADMAALAYRRAQETLAFEDDRTRLTSSTCRTVLDQAG